MQQWYYDMQVNGNRNLEGKKDRRRQSVAIRKFNSGAYVDMQSTAVFVR